MPKFKQPVRRSGEAIAAQHRKAGPMAHRLEPKGGSKAALVNPDDLIEIHNDCGGQVSLRFDVWACDKCRQVCSIELLIRQGAYKADA